MLKQQTRIKLQRLEVHAQQVQFDAQVENWGFLSHWYGHWWFGKQKRGNLGRNTITWSVLGAHNFNSKSTTYQFEVTTFLVANHSYSPGAEVWRRLHRQPQSKQGDAQAQTKLETRLYTRHHKSWGLGRGSNVVGRGSGECRIHYSISHVPLGRSSDAKTARKTPKTAK